MSTVEEALRRRLLDTAAVTTITQKVSEDWSGEDPGVDRVTIQRVDLDKHRSVDGPDADGMREVDVQIDGWSTSKATSIALIQAIEAALDGFEGTVTPEGGSPVEIKDIVLQSERSGRDPRTKEFRQTQDYRVYGVE